MTSQLRYDSSNRFVSGRLISGVCFTSISFLVFKKRRGWGVAFAPVQERPKKPSLNRVKKHFVSDMSRMLQNESPERRNNNKYFM